MGLRLSCNLANLFIPLKYKVWMILFLRSLSNLILDPGLREQLAFGVSCPPGVWKLCRPPLPWLQVDCGPDHVEEAEHDEAHVLQELALAIEEDPEEESHQGWHSEGPGVVPQPREIESYLDPEIFRNFIWEIIHHSSSVLLVRLPKGWTPNSCLTQERWSSSRQLLSWRG